MAGWSAGWLNASSSSSRMPTTWSSWRAGRSRRWRTLGYEIREVIATNNERGTLHPEWSAAHTAEARREEARAGAKVLGVNPDVEFLGYEDGRL